MPVFILFLAALLAFAVGSWRSGISLLVATPIVAIILYNLPDPSYGVAPGWTIVIRAFVSVASMLALPIVGVAKFSSSQADHDERATDNHHDRPDETESD